MKMQTCEDALVGWVGGTDVPFGGFIPKAPLMALNRNPLNYFHVEAFQHEGMELGQPIGYSK